MVMIKNRNKVRALEINEMMTMNRITNLSKISGQKHCKSGIEMIMMTKMKNKKIKMTK